MNLLLVAAGAAAGAPVRWWVDRWIQMRSLPALPWGTFVVNVVGSMLLGAIAHAASDDSAALLLMGIGFCGAMTTFSSFAWETFRLVEDGGRLLGLVNAIGSAVVCVVAAAAGWAVAGTW